MKRLTYTFATLPAILLAPSGASAAAFIDGGFETQGATVAAFCFFPSICPAGAWRGLAAGGGTPPEARSGLQDESDTNFPGTATSDGTKYGFIQSTGELIQTFTADSSGIFTLSWLDAGRQRIFTNAPTVGNQTYNVFLDAASLGAFATTTGQPFTERSSSTSFSLTAGTSYTLRFSGTSAPDTTGYIDRIAFNAVSVAPPVPEPATWAMMIGGFGLVGGAMRRRARRVGYVIV